MYKKAIVIILITASFLILSNELKCETNHIFNSHIKNNKKILIEKRNSFNYSVNDPAVLKKTNNSNLWITINPEKVLYQKGEIPNIVIICHKFKGLSLSWELRNGFGVKIIYGSEFISKENYHLEVLLPSNEGYYELIACVISDSKNIAETRRSIGIIRDLSQMEEKDLFGIWVQGNEYYDQLGVQWTRKAIYFDQWKKYGSSYLQKTHKQLRLLRDVGINLLLYPKNIPDELISSRDVLKHSIQAWSAWRNLLEQMVIEFRDDAAAWAVINEPEVTHWAGDNDLIVSYWKMMREIIDIFDPGKPLIGPSLNPNKPKLLEQYRDLLSKGFGEIIDGIEFHTYMRNIKHDGKIIHLAMPEEIEWEKRMASISEWTTEEGKEKSIWISEMGMPARYEEELIQAQFLVRCFLWGKKMNVRTIIWHCFSYPQGKKDLVRNYSIFRNGLKGAIPQPRPAAVALAVIIRQLSGARFIQELDNIEVGVTGFEFKRENNKIIVLWSLNGEEREVKIHMMESEIIRTDIFGLTQMVNPENSIISLIVGASPVYLTVRSL